MLTITINDPSKPTPKQELYLTIRRGLLIREEVRKAFDEAHNRGDKQRCAELRKKLSWSMRHMLALEREMEKLPGTHKFTDDDLRRWGVTLLQ